MMSNRDKCKNIFGAEQDWLCHYTNFDNLCSILSTMTLKISSYDRSNDISEVESNITMLLDASIEEKLEQYIIQNCGYISFSKNKWNKDRTEIVSVGYRIPSMWGIYADRSRGACLVIDEEKLLDENRDVLAISFNKWIDVDYNRISLPKLVPRNTPLETIFKDNYKQMLGYKHYSWCFEQERRLIGINLPPSLSLKNGVIKGVVMGCRSTEEDKTRLIKIIKDSKLSCLGNIDMQQWVYQEPLMGDMFTSEAGTYFNLQI